MNKYVVYNPINKHNTLTIFDWDDTLFPTTEINGLSSTVLSRNIRLMLDKLDNINYNLLNNFMGKGKVMIVTNASLNWIKYTMQYLPNTADLIKRKNIEIYSARDNFKDQLPDTLWKIATFNKITNNMNKYINIISIGDAQYEYDALVNLNEFLKYPKYLKSVKLMRYPSFEKLLDQLSVLNLKSGNIIRHKNNLDLSFE